MVARIRGVFRFGDGQERTKTVDGVGMSTRLADDAARFVAHLREFGWLFPEGRGVLVETLGIAAHDGGLIALGGMESEAPPTTGTDSRHHRLPSG